MMNDYELDNLHTEYLEKIENLVKEHYLKACNYQPRIEITLDNGEIVTFSKALVPVNGYTHIAKVYTAAGEIWMYARELTADEKKNAPEGCDWDVDNKYAKFYRHILN